jgi:predicted permease
MPPDAPELRGAGGTVWRRLRRLFGKDPLTDVNAELAFHLDMRAAELVDRGLTPDAARRAAVERFGDLPRIQQECGRLASRRERTLERMERMMDAWQDFRLAVRSIRRRPLFAATAALALALGLAATLSIWAMVDTYLFRPLPFPNADRLVVIGQAPYSSVSYPNFLDIQARRDLFDDAVIYDNAGLNVRIDDGVPTVQLYEATSGNYFPSLQVPLHMGRGYTEQEFTERAPVVVLTHAAWMARFNGAPDVIGKTVYFNGSPFAIIGVTAEGFGGMRQYLLPVEGFLPLTSALSLDSRGAAALEERDQSSYRVAALLKPGVTLAAARAGLAVLADQVKRDHPELSDDLGFVTEWETRSRPDIVVAGVIPWAAAIFLLLTGLVLLIGCTNVAGLLLARASARRGEIAVRRALGATPGRMVRLVFAESLVLTLLGMVFAVPMISLMLRWFTGIRMSTDFPVRFSASGGSHLILPAVVIALLAAVLTSIAPALHAQRLPLQETLKDGGRGGSGGRGRRRARTVLVGAQVAVSFILLVCAALFARSVQAAQRLDLGFRPDGVAMATTDAEMLRYDRARGQRLFRDLLERARTLPGVESAALIRDLPLGYNTSSRDVYFDHDIGVRDNRADIIYNVVSPGYFETLGYPLQAGRDFTVRDDSAAVPGVVINSEMAERYWPGEPAVGRRIRLAPDGEWFTVLGVVGSGPYVFTNEAPRSYLYLAMGQRFSERMTLVLRAPGDPMGTLTSVRRLIHELDPDLPVTDLRTMNAHLRGGLAFLFPRLAAQAAIVIGLLGLLQAVVGLYGVMAFSVAERTPEIGIRMAMGAQPGSVVRGVLGDGLRLTLAGMLIGVIGAIGVAQLMRAVLVGIGTTDLISYLIAALLLLSVTMLAAWIPARRAARLDVVAALRGGE